jgi:ubiquinone/menaquinone biosynthesis C-methylase UbiE
MRAELTAAGIAFDRVAGSYDEVFTHSAIGRAQRIQVSTKLLAAFPPGSRILELNCGTGEDARFLAERGRRIVACDASAAMIEVARNRLPANTAAANLEFLHLANEDLGHFPGRREFDGAFSNFSGLNCVADLHAVAADLAELVRPGGRLLLCLWGRICLTEVLWYLLHGQPQKAIRRFSGKSTARIGSDTISVFYPTVRAVRWAFSPWFKLRSRCAVGLFVPPSYVENWIRGFPKALERMEVLDRLTNGWPGLRALGDHVLMECERCKQ